jgi:hypothetical protein
MVRTRKELKPVTKDDLLEQFVRVRLSHDVLQEAISSLKDGESLEVEYVQSLSRGADALETFTNSLKVALAQFTLRRQIADSVAANMNAIARGAVVSASQIAPDAPIERAAVTVGRKPATKASPSAKEIKAMTSKPARESKHG